MKAFKPTFSMKLTVAALAIISMCTPLVAEYAFANPYGTEITINDGIGTNGTGAFKEDNEAEPGMVQSQAWDLEGFFLKGKILTIIGGYNFSQGEAGMMAGDIFIDTNGDAVHSPNTISSHTYKPYEKIKNKYFNYDYVLDIDWKKGTYDVVELNVKSLLKDTEYGSQYNQPSNPWIYLRGGKTIASGTFNIETKNDSDTGLNGWGADKHYVASFDISKIDLSNGALFHNTMQCGNDNLLGQIAPVPEPATMLLFGTGIAGLAGMVRRRRMNG